MDGRKEDQEEYLQSVIFDVTIVDIIETSRGVLNVRIIDVQDVKI